MIGCLFALPITVLIDAQAAGAAVVPEPRDPTTGEPVVPRDMTGQPIVPRDEEGQLLLLGPNGEPLQPPSRVDSLLRPVGPNGVLSAEEIDGRPRVTGGTDWRGQVALVEGYNTNVLQSQQLVGGPVTHHASPFTGVDASAQMLTWTSPTDEQIFRLQVRGQHYTPVDGYKGIPDDGTINGGWSGTITLGPRTVVQGRALATVTSVNSAQIDDGTLFLIDPSSLQRDYTLEAARLAVVHELAPRWRLVLAGDVEMQTTLRDSPIALPDGTTTHHHGLDYVQPGLDATLFHDLDERNIGMLRVRYAPTYIAFLVDYARVPPLYGGHALVHMGEGEIGWTHAFSERVRSLLTLGTLYSQAPPLDPDRRPIMSPLANVELSYTKEYWLMAAGASYAYGSANPRLGFGPSIGATATMQGVPFPLGPMRNLAVIVSGAANRAAFREGAADLARLSYASGQFEVRYGVNAWLGILAGYDVRYVVFEGAAAFPPLLRNIVFVGLGGSWSTDHVLPTLETFVSPVTPPG